MKKLLITLVCCAIFGSLSFAQQDVAPKTDKVVINENPNNATGPQMLFEKETVDYGVIEQESDPLRTFTFTNAGTEPLVIKYARGSCGCTVPEWPKEPIGIGEDGIIKVKFDSKKKPGLQNKTVTLTANTFPKQTRIRIKANVEAAAKADQPS